MKYYFYYILMWLFICSQNAVAINKEREVIIAASASIHPYVFVKTDSGIHLNLIKAALNANGFANINVQYMSNKRAEHQLHNKGVDILLNYAGGISAGIYPSKTVLSYENVAITLKRNKYNIDKIEGMFNKNVLAFQNATAYLPPIFKRNVKHFSSYQEVINQKAQVDKLLKGWVDVIVLDKRIFYYYYNQHKSPEAVQIYTLFPKADRPAYFNNFSLATEFDIGLALIKQNGTYKRIVDEGQTHSSIK
ncbi:transporter substrate-binding domain-containing protein [Pseudoalteromonas sp. NZS127_1]|uniref:substrate-binding periplasmic protein n=2 Tax=Pseudoalteromonas TaxID=53246 RepID=UPI0004639C4B|nr:transporter substrate-binding domain-containing protein [Pseudoalteromonas sp. TB13]MBG9995252.1 transporter substrate-binding domain-containing protein [Pseudoalteromonas sp. NZS127_1]MBH0040898.1 transporter substrate-binding domain-containing protein [Pseudoalteromonas sp. SWXJZ10B]